MSEVAARFTDRTTNVTGAVKAILGYRCMSLVVTCAFYFAGPPRSQLGFKLGVAVCLLAATALVAQLYRWEWGRPARLAAVVLAEVSGIALLLVPTGGLDSPFFWYALNPVIVTAWCLPLYCCWLTLTIFIACAAFTSLYFSVGSVSELIALGAEKVLAAVLITAAVQTMAFLNHKLEDQSSHLQLQRLRLIEANGKLEKANQDYRRAIHQLTALFKTVEALVSSPESRSCLLTAFVSYAAELTGSSEVFIVLNSGEMSCNRDCLESLRPHLAQLCAVEGDRLTQEAVVAGDRFVLVPISTAAKSYGFIGLQRVNQQTSLLSDSLRAVATICAVALERQELEVMKEQLLVAQEQNRIANEIHDSVVQRLFSVVYAAHALVERSEQKVGTEQLRDQLKLIRDTSAAALKELRASIYQLSAKQQGGQAFVAGLKSYLDELAKLHELELKCHLDTKVELLPVKLKQAINRLVREASGNAIRHGCCTRMAVQISCDSQEVQIEIRDNGVGFNPNSTTGGGLGLTNMHYLVESLSGQLAIESNAGGTTVTAVIPVSKELVS